MKDINSGDQIFTFFTKQHTFEVINKSLLQSKENYINNLEDSIIAPMHGIVKIKKIKANSIVKKGDVLFILEAMKMEFSLTSPRDGIIERIFIIDGQQVSDKMKLLSLKK